MDLHLKELRALVTGASRGLGYATALALAGEGCRVAINSRDRARIEAAADTLTRQTGTQVIGFSGDVSVASEVKLIVEESATAMGGLDILVCNSGGPPAGSFESFDEAAWQKAVDLSFMSHVRLIQAAL